MILDFFDWTVFDLCGEPKMSLLVGVLIYSFKGDKTIIIYNLPTIFRKEGNKQWCAVTVLQVAAKVV